MFLDPAFVRGAFGLKKPGDTSGVIESSSGWHVDPARRAATAEVRTARRAAGAILGGDLCAPRPRRARGRPVRAPLRHARRDPARRGRADGGGQFERLAVSLRRRRSSRARARATAPPARDNDASSFSPILQDFIGRVPGAHWRRTRRSRWGSRRLRGARRHRTTSSSPGAHWQIVLKETCALTDRSGLGVPRALAVRGERRSFIVHALPDDYALVLAPWSPRRLYGRRTCVCGLRAFSRRRGRLAHPSALSNVVCGQRRGRSDGAADAPPRGADTSSVSKSWDASRDWRRGSGAGACGSSKAPS